ncbi:acyltransferase family protein [Glycomyces tritici]|uniref:Acyltransferase family protein n=1 Tax=Glycomyces tritici TaxID=2665176 RepID=A0ABT7YQ17_9ACTN|nr:acyltransferase family protein [Glycomyces tritici]MDN3240690.1 acyltransferase family protein [Glycomyces tritici]
MSHPASTSDATTAPPATARPAARPPRLREIDGLRGLAIVVIAVYHIWFDRVSGGVDVFLLLSGFFITASLLRSVDRTGSVAPLAFASRIVRRIFPPALVVVAASVVMAVLWLPRATWLQQVGDLLAAALYYANWHLALNSVDYLSSNNGASIVQHYWSMGVQAQFYVLWPILIAAAVAVAARTGRSPRRTLAAALALVFAASFAFALWETAENQAFAYFDLRARLWQFAAGGLLALALPRLRTAFTDPAAPQAKWTAALLGWAGVAVLLGAGFFLESTQFPGLAALWPVGGACAVVTAASLSPGAGAGRLLNTGFVQWLGDLSYTLYLWHWPILICYLTATGRDTATLPGGLGILAAATALAAATHWALERRLTLGQRTKRGAFALGAASMAFALAACAAMAGYIAFERERLAEAAHDPARHPGAAALAEGLEVAEADFTPSTLDAALDYDPALSGRCNQTMTGYEPVRCDFSPGDDPGEESDGDGEEDEDGAADGAGTAATVVMYGGSKIWQWLPAVLDAAEDRDWHVIAFTKNACIIETGQEALGEERYRSCAAWNDAVVAEIAAIGPDLVLTYGSRVGYEAYETFPEYTDRYEQLLATGTPVVALRDTPSPRFDIPLCVDLNGPDANECTVDRASYYDEGAFEALEVPAGVHKVDLTGLICDGDACPPVVGNVLVYRDDAHLTNTYAATLGPYLGDELAAVLANPAAG